MAMHRSPGAPQTCLIVLLLLATLVSCGNGDDDEPGEQASPSDEQVEKIEFLSANVERAVADNAAAASAAEIVTTFGSDLYAELRSTDGNLAISPYSVAVALSMTRVGAADTTASEMDAVLHTDLVEDLDAAIGSLEAELGQRPGTFPMPEGDPVELELSFGNALWPQRDFDFEADFLDTLARHYGTGVQAVDYVANTEGARDAINGWVSDQTRDRIPELIPSGVLDVDTRLVLTNAVYLNAPWVYPFTDGGTEDAVFNLLDGQTVQTPTMQLSESLSYGRGDGWQAVALPYVNGELAMVVLVPDAGQFDSIEAALDAELIADVNTSMSGRQVNLRLPRWEYRVQTDLVEPLQNLGMTSAFTDQADFSNMSPTPLFISDVLHEVFISVDEKGTEAAAATAVAMSLTAGPADPPVDLTVDRPFIYWITDQPTGAALFLGRVVNPTQP